jgi:hypothetical protein
VNGIASESLTALLVRFKDEVAILLLLFIISRRIGRRIGESLGLRNGGAEARVKNWARDSGILEPSLV